MKKFLALMLALLCLQLKMYLFINLIQCLTMESLLIPKQA